MLNRDQQLYGVFSQPGYISIGDKYPKKHSNFIPFNMQSGKGKQLMMEKSKPRSAHQDGYFDRTFKRVFEKEAYHDALKAKRRDRMAKKQQNIGGTFVPTDAEKTRNGSGMHYGTLSGPIEHFSAVYRPKPPSGEPKPNLYTNPGKKGTGWGYVNLTLGGEYIHRDEKYDRSKELYKEELMIEKKKIRAGAFKLNNYPIEFFNRNPYGRDAPLGPKKPAKKKPKNLHAAFVPSSPGKVPAGAKMGTFDPYPEHSTDPYKIKVKRKAIPKMGGQLFGPQPRLKSRPIRSILDYNVNVKTNEQNYRSLRKVTSY